MSSSAQWFLDTAGQIFSGMAVHINPAIEQFREVHSGLQESDILYVQVAHGFAPEPIAPGFFTKRSPYGNPATAESELEAAVERGWLEPAGKAQYTLTAKGAELAREFFAFADKTIGAIEPLPEADINRATELLSKVVELVGQLPEPAEKWAFSWGAKFDRGPTAPATVRLRRCLLDLLVFRDDVHIAAWRPFEPEGHNWEAFTYVWRDEAGSAAELAEKLPYRSFEEATYAAALEELAARGWIAEEEGKYIATAQGRALRQEAEDATDRLYDAAWEALTPAETEELKGLLERLAEAVKPPETED